MVSEWIIYNNLYWYELLFTNIYIDDNDVDNDDDVDNEININT